MEEAASVVFVLDNANTRRKWREELLSVGLFRMSRVLRSYDGKIHFLFSCHGTLESQCNHADFDYLVSCVTRMPFLE